MGSRLLDLHHEALHLSVEATDADREQRLPALMNRIVEGERIPLHRALDLEYLCSPGFRLVTEIILETGTTVVDLSRRVSVRTPSPRQTTVKTGEGERRHR